VRIGPKAIGAGATFGAIVLGLACNAIVGNDDIQFVVEAGPFDATTVIEASLESGPARAEASVEDAGSNTLEAAALSEASPAVEAGCEAGTKSCAGSCAAFDDPGYGCGPTRCSPCELLNAVSLCASLDAGDAGADGGALACSVAVCKADHADCNGRPFDGCETDLSDDLYNCGACGHDCSNLPHVAGNVSCVAGACSFDGGSCAPGYGICSANPDNGCDTGFTVAAHCGGCTTTCSGGLPDCSTTGNVNQPFVCTSGCAPGLSLCAASCVDERTDPNHCGSCGKQCPAVAGATPTCAAGGMCGFTCNANNHLCNGACVNEQTDPDNCGSCSHVCGAGQACSGGQCICNATSCPNGCCDGNQVCQPASACGSAGACATGCPATIPEAGALALWLVGDTYAAGSPTWTDQSGHGNATCSPPLCPSTAVWSGHTVVSFDGTSYFALGDPGAPYHSTAFTIFVVAAPDPAAASNAQLIAFADNAGNSVGLLRSAGAQDLMLQLLTASSAPNSLVATGAWGGPGAFERIVSGVDATPNAFLTVPGTAAVTGSIGAPPAVNYYLSSYLGTDPATHTLNYVGQIAEVLVFDTTLSSASVSSVLGYLSTRYPEAP
jgi:hypothetical protein